MALADPFNSNLVRTMYPENLTLVTTSAAVELSVATDGDSSSVKLHAQLSPDHQRVFTDGGKQVTDFLVTVFCLGDDGVEIPEFDEGQVGELKTEPKRCLIVLNMKPSQFERLQSAVMAGATFEVFMTIDALEESSGPEIILRTAAHTKLPVWDVIFTAAPRK